MSQLACAAWLDEIITEAERDDLHAVGALLGIGSDAIDDLVEEARRVERVQPIELGSFGLSAGDFVVFTGEMSRERSEWENIARSLGLTPHGAVTKKVKLVIAGGPDSMSGKARKARDYRIPIVTEEYFSCMTAGGLILTK